MKYEYKRIALIREYLEPSEWRFVSVLEDGTLLFERIVPDENIPFSNNNSTWTNEKK